jgi:hypothetical protein
VDVPLADLGTHPLHPVAHDQRVLAPDEVGEAAVGNEAFSSVIRDADGVFAT